MTNRISRISIEDILAAPKEDQNIDFKAPCEWDVRTFAKDILALSNVQDGGRIVVGVEENQDLNTFLRKGISQEQRESFNRDIMKDQMASYADPGIDFIVEFPKDNSGFEYALIRVFEFDEIPVICKKDSRDTSKGVIYYRTSTGRNASAPVANSTDMRKIIQIATVKMMRNLKHLGLDVDNNGKNRFDEELGGL